MARLLQRVFLVCGILMLLDIAFFGPGLVLPVVGISLRRILFLIILLVLGFRRAVSERPFSQDEIAFAALLAAFAVFWGIVVPSSYGFLLSQSFADISPWLGLLMIALWPWDAWPAAAQWRSFCGFVIAVAVLLAVVHLAIWALLVSNLISPEVFSITARLVSPDSDGEGFLRITPLDGGQFRVFWSSSIFLLGGVYFLIVTRGSKTRVGWSVALALACFALGTTYIRSFLGAMAIFAVLGFALRRTYRRSRVHWPIGTVLCIWLAAIVSVSVAINPAVLASIGLARDVSDIDRVEQATALLNQFQAHPLLGSGFGSYVYQVVRGTETPFSYELVFYALIMKLGLVGVCVLLVILALALRLAFAQTLAARRSDSYALWVAFTTGMWFAGATNPMVTNFVGMTIVVLLFIDMRMRACVD